MSNNAPDPNKPPYVPNLAKPTSPATAFPQITFPAGSDIVLHVLPNDDAGRESLEMTDEAERFRVTLIVAPEHLGAIIKPLHLSLEYKRNPFQLPIHGVVSPRPRSDLTKVISMNEGIAKSPKIRRKSWSLDRWATYRFVPIQGYPFNGDLPDRVGSGISVIPNNGYIYPQDLVGEDWETVAEESMLGDDLAAEEHADPDTDLCLPEPEENK
jgi:hypothetical protein